MAPDADAPQSSVAAVVAAAERILSQAQGGEVSIGAVWRLTEPQRKNVVLRCQVAPGLVGAPAAVIVKRK